MEIYKSLKRENKQKLYRGQQANLIFYELLVARKRYHKYDQTLYPNLVMYA